MRIISFAVGAWCLWAGVASAQSVGQLQGRVTTRAGEPVVGAVLAVAGSELVGAVSVRTNAAGRFVILALAPGMYRASVETTGRTSAGVDVVVEGSGVTRLDLMVDSGGGLTVRAGVVGGTIWLREELGYIPTARDPWQTASLTAGVEAGINVAGANSHQQVSLAARGASANLHWSLHGGATTDLSSNSSSAYFNFSGLQSVTVVTAGRDVTTQTPGIAIDLRVRGGSRSFAGLLDARGAHHRFQSNNVSPDAFDRGEAGVLSGAPLRVVSTLSAGAGGPLFRDSLRWWLAADRQRYDLGVVNYFDPARGTPCADFADAMRTGTIAADTTFGDLGAIQRCLANDRSTIRSTQLRLDGSPGRAHQLQYVFYSHNKERGSRGASANAAPEATTRQTSEPWGKWFPVPTHHVVHRWQPQDRVVLSGHYTYVGGGFNLDYQDSNDGCGLTTYRETKTSLPPPRSTCLSAVQPLTIQTTGHQSRSLQWGYQTQRRSHDVGLDAAVWLSGPGGTEHTLKFGAGYRRSPVLSYQHMSGGGSAVVQCVGNTVDGCGDGRTFVTPGASAGLVPLRALLRRDQLINSRWWSWTGYVQDAVSWGRATLTAGVRYDWQHSRWMGGCVPANVVRPDLLPAQCQEATTGGPDPVSGGQREIQPFRQWSPRASLAVDVRGDGRTIASVSGAYYFETRVVLANALSALGAVTLTWGSNQSTGACRPSAGSCWTDANRDGSVQPGELFGVPSGNGGFNLTTGVLTPTGSIVSDDALIARTRELTAGVLHQLRDRVVVGANVIFRRQDRGFANYTAGTEPGSAGYPLSQLYTGPLLHTDGATGITAPYYVIRTGLIRPSGTTIAATRQRYDDYLGADLTMQRRHSGRWHAAGVLTLQKRTPFLPVEWIPNGNPTGNEFEDGRNTISRYQLKAWGGYDLPWALTASTVLHVADGAVRTLVINGPGAVYGGSSPFGAPTAITYDTLAFEPVGATRYEAIVLWDLGLQKRFTVGSRRATVAVEAFNLLNQMTVLSYLSNNVSLAGTAGNPTRPSERITALLPPRVFRLGLTIDF